VQTVPKESGLLFDGVFVDARKSVVRHGTDTRQDAPFISERIVVTPYHVHHCAQGKSSVGKYRLVGCMPP
jgi:hypothetical protein